MAYDFHKYSIADYDLFLPTSRPYHEGDCATLIIYPFINY
jgi:hypothetical protein